MPSTISQGLLSGHWIPQILRSKFDEFKRTVEAGTERFNMCERQARYLTEDRGDHTGEVAERQENIR